MKKDEVEKLEYDFEYTSVLLDDNNKYNVIDVIEIEDDLPYLKLEGIDDLIAFDDDRIVTIYFKPHILKSK